MQWRHSVKTRLYKNPPPYFIVLASSVKTKEVEVIEFHRIVNGIKSWKYIVNSQGNKAVLNQPVQVL